MTKVRYDLGLDITLKNVEVEGEGLSGSKEKLMSMTIEELIECGYIKDFVITEIESEIIENDAKLRVYDIEYDTDGDLPNEMVLNIHIGENDDIYEIINYEIWLMTSEDAIDFKFEILEDGGDK